MIHSSSVIAESAKIGKNVQVGPFCYIGENVEIGENGYDSSEEETETDSY